MKKIAKKEAKYAECLKNWRECLSNEGIEISDKDFDKFWVNYYIRSDTCTKNERARANKNYIMRIFDKIMRNKKNIFDLSHEGLEGLRNFLSKFRKQE